jgi:hypothetical protein
MKLSPEEKRKHEENEKSVMAKKKLKLDEGTRVLTWVTDKNDKKIIRPNDNFDNILTSAEDSLHNFSESES